MNFKRMSKEQYLNVLKEQGIPEILLQQFRQKSTSEIEYLVNQFSSSENQIQLLSTFLGWRDYTVVYSNDKNSIIWSGELDGAFPNIPLPKLSPNPYDAIPSEGDTFTEIAMEWGDYIYVSLENTKVGPFTDSDQALLDVMLHMGPIEDMVILPGLKNGDIITQYPNKTTTSLPLGTKVVYLGFPTSNSAVKALLQDSKKQRRSKYRLIGSSLQDRRVDTEYAKSHTYGTEVEETTTCAYEIGANVKVEVGVPFFAKTEIDLSGKLARQYSWGNKVTNSDTITQTYKFSRPGKDYKYSDYAYAVYQLHSEYEIIFGSGFHTLLQNVQRIIGDSYALKNVQLVDNYSENQDTIYATQTPDPTPPSRRNLIQVIPPDAE